jgi:hypothetical protein
MSGKLKGEKERFALALLAESCENETYLEEYRHNQIVLSVSIEPMSETPVSRSHRNCQRLVVSTPSRHWIRGPITTRTCGSYQALD